MRVHFETSTGKQIQILWQGRNPKTGQGSEDVQTTVTGQNSDKHKTKTAKAIRNKWQ